MSFSVPPSQRCWGSPDESGPFRRDHIIPLAPHPTQELQERGSLAERIFPPADTARSPSSGHTGPRLQVRSWGEEGKESGQEGWGREKQLCSQRAHLEARSFEGTLQAALPQPCRGLDLRPCIPGSCPRRQGKGGLSINLCGLLATTSRHRAGGLCPRLPHGTLGLVSLSPSLGCISSSPQRSQEGKLIDFLLKEPILTYDKRCYTLCF